MFYESPFWEQLIFLIGEFTTLMIVGLMTLSFIIVIISFLSIKNGRFYFPRLVKSGLVLTEGMVKAICRLFCLDDKELIGFFIRLTNTMNSKAFEETPVEKRAIFIPQCLRSAECPAHLTPEGLVCRRCGKCEIGMHIDELEKLGYHVWIAPGSTLIKRMVKKYRPEAIIGIGCMMEVKEGLEMLDKMDLVGMGVVTLRDGCVETLVNWTDVLDVAYLGLEHEDI